MKEQVNYSVMAFPDLLSLAVKGDKNAATEVIAREAAQKAEIEQLNVHDLKTVLGVKYRQRINLKKIMKKIVKLDLQCKK
jgi:hypothetical protein